MTQTEFLRIALPTPLRRVFDYLPPEDFDPTTLIPGVRILVPFQARQLVGILIEVAKTSTLPYEKLKKAEKILDNEPILSADVYQLCHWAADYYHYALGEVLASALPTLLRKNKTVKIKNKKNVITIKPQLIPELNAAQKIALTAIDAAQDSFKVFLLDGVTGSGKTEVYLRAIENNLQLNKQILVLVPEISLTPQTIERFRARFNVEIVTLHSNLSEQERLSAWLAAKSGSAKIVIGTRSAVFTSFKSLGLIIVDEEHDTSFKQQDRFRYHARDVAIMRANFLKIPVVLGSATPSLESLLNVKRHRYDYLSLPQRAGDAQLPQYQIVNLKQTDITEGLSTELLTLIREHLAQDNQVMLFLNRRGFAPVLYCTNCTFIMGCARCATRMVYHRSPARLHCHHCDAQKNIPKQCEKCGQSDLQPVGLGTQRLEEILTKLFSDIPIIRVDRDSTRRKNTLEKMLDDIHTQKKAILLGTQMLAKGHHFPNVTLVGIIDADSGFFSADFRAAEQMGQLLLQVSGRAGRAEKPGTVLIQTYQPEHPLLQTLLQHGYQFFSENLLSERETALLPPYAYFAVLRAESYIEKKAEDFLNKIKEKMSAANITMLGPTPAILAKIKGMHRKHLILRANKREVLQSFLQNMIEQIEKSTDPVNVKWMLDVDPVEV